MAASSEWDRLEGKPRTDEIQVVKRDYSGQSKHYVYPLGDLHIGAREHNAELWAEWLTFLARRKNASLIGTGDFLNSAIIGSKSDVYDETMTVGGAKRALRGQLQLLAEQNRIDLLIPGNHEDRITRATGDCPIYDVAEWLSVPYAEAAALIEYRVGAQVYRVYVRHGTGNGQSLVALGKAAKVIVADAYCTGHVHRQAVTVDDILIPGDDGVRRMRQVFLSSGSFLGLEKYALQRGYAPGHMGAPRIFLDGERHDIHVSI